VGGERQRERQKGRKYEKGDRLPLSKKEGGGGGGGVAQSGVLAANIWLEKAVKDLFVVFFCYNAYSEE
jgi:hypothetical protein